MALRKRVWRTIKESKGRYTGIFILVFLGSLAFVVMSGIGNNLANMVGGFAEDNLQEDVVFGTNMPVENLSSLESASGAVIDSYMYYDTAFQSGEIRILSSCEKINLPAVIEGRGIERPGEILVDPTFLNAHGLEIGGQTELGGRAFTIAGTVAAPHYTYVLKNVHDIMPTPGFGIGFISEEDFAAFPEAETLYSARFTNRDNINSQMVHLYNLLIERGYSLTEWADATTNNRIQMPWASITGMRTMSAPVATAMFLLCCLIAGVVLKRTVKADSVIIGTLYAQGYRRRELVRHYMAIPLRISAAAGLAGTLLALPCVKPAVVMMTVYYNVPVSAMTFSAPTIALGILLPAILMSASGYFVVRGVLKKSAAELMRGDAQKVKINIFERRLRLERFKFVTKFRLREQLRSIPRLLFLVLGISAASVLMMFGLTINNSMNAIFGGDMGDTYNFAMEYTFKEARTGDVPEGADAFSAARCFPEGRESVEFYLTGIGPGANSIVLRDSRGNELPQDQVNITHPLANRLGVKIGDEVRVVNKLNGHVYTLTIGGIVQTYSEQFIYMPLDGFNQMTGQAAGSYMGLFSDRELDFDPRLLSGVKDLRNMDSAMDELASTMTATILFITILAAIIGMVIIFLVISLIIEESRVTISMLKVFGYRGKEIAKLILNSSTAAVIIGFCLGFPIMLATANTMFAYLGEMINLMLPMIVNPLHILISFIVIFAVYLLTRYLCGRKLAQTPFIFTAYNKE